MISTDMETTDVREVGPEAPQPTQINVHIHQESALAKLLLAGCSVLRLPASASARGLGSSSRLLVVSWVVQIVLGILSVILGGILYTCQDFVIDTSGAPFWTGIVAMLAGAVAFLHKKWGGTCWALLRTLLVLANFCMAVAAIVLGARRFNHFHYYLGNYICKDSSSDRWFKSVSTPVPEEADRRGLCILYISMLRTLLLSLQAMLLGVWVLLLLASLTPVCVFFWKRCFTKAKTDEKKPLGASVI